MWPISASMVTSETPFSAKCVANVCRKIMQAALDPGCFAHQIPPRTDIRNGPLWIRGLRCAERENTMRLRRLSKARNEPLTMSYKNFRKLVIDGYSPARTARCLCPTYGECPLEQIDLNPSQRHCLTRAHSRQKKNRNEATDHWRAQNRRCVENTFLLVSGKGPPYILPFFELPHFRPKDTPTPTNRSGQLTKFHVDCASAHLFCHPGAHVLANTILIQIT